MASYKMKATKRENIGSNKVNKLRAEKLIPGVIYKKGEETKSLQVDERDFQLTFRNAGTTSVIDLDLDGETHSVIVREVQKHPVKNEVLHIDFLELNMDEVLNVMIPVNLVGRDEIKLQPSVLTQLLNEVEIECLPNNIPNTADVDVTDMDFVDPLFVSDLDIAKDEDITILTEEDIVVCTLSEPDLEEEEDEDELDEEADAADVPVIGEDEKEEE
ncbi:MAG: 50S ribosomal protein L25 [Tissierella sp.]|uniref:50S ribosomal protein L25 n=1 Tax=Tissierella sp. TaxID=41274 RepID=UPI003F99D427